MVTHTHTVIQYCNEILPFEAGFVLSLAHLPISSTVKSLGTAMLYEYSFLVNLEECGKSMDTPSMHASLL